MEKSVSSKKRIVLASASPRRREILKQLGIDFEVIPSTLEENVTEEDPGQIVEKLSAQKARDVLEQKVVGDCTVIGSDTIVVCEGKILGKPATKKEAYDMINLLQGKTHRVYTGVAILDRTKERVSCELFSEFTLVRVSAMTEEEITDYLFKENVMDKAGAYGIQGYFAAFIEKIEGEYSTVLGLPIAGLYRHMKILREREINE